MNFRHRILPLAALLAACLLAPGCRSYRKLLQDEVVLQDGSSETGRITACDSTQLSIQKADLSRQVIPWENIDTVQSISHRTKMLSFQLGIHSTPYFSLFQNADYEPVALGGHFRYGAAAFGKHLRYLTLGFIGGKPYGVTKLGAGYQRWLFTRYTDPYSFHAGFEANFMFIRNNNTPQLSFEPFVGGDYHLADQFRVCGRLGFQKNILGANPSLGVNLSVGVNFLFRNFKAHYHYLHTQHALPKRFNP